MTTLAKIRCPVDTGNLMNSITPDVSMVSGDKPSSAVFTNVDYAAYVEFGTINQAAQPYMTPAFETVKDEFAKFLRAYMDRNK